MLMFEIKGVIIQLYDCDLEKEDFIWDNGDFFDVSLSSTGMHKICTSHALDTIESAWVCVKSDGCCYLFTEDEDGVCFYKSLTKYTPESIKKRLDNFNT